MEWRHHASDSTHNPHTTCDTITCDTASLSFSSSSYSYSFSYSLEQPYLLFSPLLLLDIPNYLFNNNTASKSSSPFLSLPFITGMHSPFDLMYLCCRPPLLPLSFFCYPTLTFTYLSTRTQLLLACCLLMICICSFIVRCAQHNDDDFVVLSLFARSRCSCCVLFWWSNFNFLFYILLSFLPFQTNKNKCSEQTNKQRLIDCDVDFASVVSKMVIVLSISLMATLALM